MEGLKLLSALILRDPEHAKGIEPLLDRFLNLDMDESSCLHLGDLILICIQKGIFSEDHQREALQLLAKRRPQLTKVAAVS